NQLPNKHLTPIFILVITAWSLFLPVTGITARARIPNKKSAPYLGAIVIRDNTGETVFEKNSDISCYPASIVKLMMLLIIQEKIEDGSLNLDDRVVCTAESARMGGSQVYLKEDEIFTIEDLLYSLIIQSANDSAVALAIHIAGSKDGFVDMMQEKARELGMKNTEFHSVHGLPPGRGQEPDLSSPKDIAILSRELLRHPEILRYTSTPVRGFRDDTFEMRSHNPLILDKSRFEGCDGLKTGYFRAGGFSISATADRDGLRLIGVVMGSKRKEDRNKAVRNILAQAFSSIPAPGPGEKPVAAARRERKTKPAGVRSRSASAPRHNPARSDNPGTIDDPTEKEEKKGDEGGGFWTTLLYILLFLIQAGFFFWLGRKSKQDGLSGYPPTILQK
ncbi:MAG: D-alanyl-D-alanine carboxypeptidase family protein, partial [Candidatus Auribacterota bacterium]|nr:D-alanyl-D-alanine carboxypeptidase family protein [Candidatus Auribacterota bacterium]